MKLFIRIMYSALLLGAGILHFVHEPSFRKIVPKALPFRRMIVLVSGVFEIAFSILLWMKKGQHIIGKLLAAFMVAVFPANIYMAMKRIPIKGDKKANPWLVWLRLPLQIPLIVGALKLGKRA